MPSLKEIEQQMRRMDKDAPHDSDHGYAIYFKNDWIRYKFVMRQRVRKVIKRLWPI